MRRRITLPLLTVAAVLASLFVAVSPAQAHGYISSPPSRQATVRPGPGRQLRRHRLRAAERRGAQGLDAVQRRRQPVRRSQRQQPQLAGHLGRAERHVQLGAHRPARHQHLGVLRRRHAGSRSSTTAARSPAPPSRTPSASAAAPAGSPCWPGGTSPTPRWRSTPASTSRSAAVAVAATRRRLRRPRATCGSAWSASAVYTGGAVVSHNGRRWQAQWWTAGRGARHDRPVGRLARPGRLLNATSERARAALPARVTALCQLYREDAMRRRRCWRRRLVVLVARLRPGRRGAGATAARHRTYNSTDVMFLQMMLAHHEPSAELLDAGCDTRSPAPTSARSPPSSRPPAPPTPGRWPSGSSGGASR